jgi:chromosomal replication initiator protein
VINACWQKCVICLREELPAQQFNTWIKPLRAAVTPDTLCLFTPNRFILDWVNEHFLLRIKEILKDQAQGHEFQVKLEIGSPALAVGDIEVRPSGQETSVAAVLSESRSLQQAQAAADDAFDILLGSAEALETLPARQIDLQQRASSGAATIKQGRKLSFRGELNPNYTFSNFIQGKSNQLARAAASQVASNPGGAYNPLFIYGGVGLGKTHLMHAIGNHLRETNPSANVVYLHSQTFVGSMVSALQLNAINEFKRYYHSVDALLIDDIQFFANKERSQEEFFHTFNAIFEGGRQIIMTCDKYHSEINGLEERLKSRFGWGLSVAVEPPEMETRAAILINKSNQENVYLGNDEAMFMAQKLRSNVRELEGALKKVVAHARFLGSEITIPLIKDALKDLLAIQSKLVSVDNIQRTVAEYYKIKMADMISKRRNRSVARPRQMAMCLSKELTNHSLPEIGTMYGGRDHTTVLHACRTISDLRKSSIDLEEDYQNLLRSLSS